MAANDIRNVDDASVIPASGTLTPQKYGVVHVKVSKLQTESFGGILTSPSGFNTDNDPNNIADKYDLRLDDTTYY